MNYRQTKKEIMTRLHGGRADVSGLPERYAVRALTGFIASHDPKIKWPAVSALGRCVASMAENDLEAGREVLRRMVWGLNEESGAVGMGLPEAMGEIMALNAGLRSEFLNLLLNYLCPGHCYLEFPPLNQGVIWALGRIAQVDPDALKERCAADYLAPLAESGDAQSRGLAVWALIQLEYAFKPAVRQKLLSDQSIFMLCSNAKLSRRAIQDLLRSR